MNGGQDGAHHLTGHRGLGELEGNRPGISQTRPPVFLLGDASNICQAVAQLRLRACQRAVGHFLGQFDAAQESGQVVGPRVQVQPDLVVAERPSPLSPP